MRLLRDPSRLQRIARNPLVLSGGTVPGYFVFGIAETRPKTYDLYAVCVSGLNRLIPRHLSESRVVYGQAVNGPLMAVRARKRCANPWGDKY
jgi:hypothetical protein